MSTPRTIGAVAVAAAIGLAALAVVLLTRPAETATTRGANASIDTAISATGLGVVPTVDYAIDLETGVMTPLPKSIIRSVGKSSGNFSRYAASPNGSRLAYVGAGDDGGPQIFVAGIDGTRIRQLTHDRIGATSPAWSPDGTKIAYRGHGSDDNKGARNVFVFDVATGEVTQVTDENRDAWGPQFAPDGSSLIFTKGPNCCPALWTVPVAGGKSTLLIGLSDGLTDAGNGSLSPDGSLITFLGGGSPTSGGQQCGPCRLVANADGTERRVIPGWYVNSAGAWSPDGSRIVESQDDHSIVVVDIATGSATHVATGNEAIWLDKHTLLVDIA